MHTAIQGFPVSSGLIIAIGAQNAFGLKQGRWHILPIILTCFFATASSSASACSALVP